MQRFQRVYRWFLRPSTIRALVVLLCAVGSGKCVVSAEPVLEAPPAPRSSGQPGPLGPPTAKQLEEIKAAVGINLFEGTLFDDYDGPASPQQPSTAGPPHRNSDADQPAGIAPRLGTHPESVERLRNAARGLELAAASLEECAIYAEADRLRDLASDLWKQARSGSIDCPKTTPSLAPVPPNPARLK